MAYTKESTIIGSQKTYRLCDDIKKYALMDVGFLQSKGGKYTLERSLDPFSPYSNAPKLKVVVSSDLQTFKITTVSNNGLREVNIFKLKDVEEMEKQLDFIVAELIDRKILTQVK